MNYSKLFHILNLDIKEFCINLKIPDFKNERLLYENQLECLIIFFLHILKGSDSLSKDYSMYIKTLPTKLNKNLFTLDLEEIGWIMNSTIYLEYESLLNYIKKLSDKISNSEFKYEFEENDLIYSYYIINSRKKEFQIKNGVYKIIIPIIDLINFEEEKVNVSIEELIEQNDFIYIKATKDILKNEALFIGYGDQNNIELFINYGITIKNNKAIKVIKNFDFILLKDDYYTIDLYYENPIEYFRNALAEIMMRLNFNKEDKELFFQFQIDMLERIKKNILEFSNKDRLKTLKNLKNKSKFLTDIYRLLKEEDLILDKNYNALEYLLDENSIKIENSSSEEFEYNFDDGNVYDNLDDDDQDDYKIHKDL